MQIDQDEEEDQMELVEKFIESLKQEQLHSTLLPFQREHYDLLKQLVSGQQDNLKQFLRHQDEETRLTDKNFRYIIYNAELDKLQYLLKMYLRIRLKKIQLYCFYFMKNIQEAEKLMSVSELKFLKKYSEMRFQYYNANIFKFLVRNYRDFKEVDNIFAKTEAEKSKEKKIYVHTNQSIIDLKAPNGNEYVFAEILQNPQHLRFGIDLNVANVSSEHMEVISQGTIVFCSQKNLQDRFDLNSYRLL